MCCPVFIHSLNLLKESTAKSLPILTKPSYLEFDEVCDNLWHATDLTFSGTNQGLQVIQPGILFFPLRIKN